MKDKILNYIMSLLLILLIVMVMFKTSSKDFQNQVYRTVNNIQMKFSGAKSPKQELKSQPSTNENKPSSQKIVEPVFGPYMRELQRHIKAAWTPPKGNESKRVVLLFKIAKDGKLLYVKVFKSSGVIAADQAAIKAVEMAAPFKPLPKEFQGKSVDIQFTFDYNVFNKKLNKF